MKKEILVLGNFGYFGKQLDGQTVKTQVLYSSLCQKYDNVDFIDVSYGQLKFLLRVIFVISSYKEVYFLPGKRMLYAFMPIIFFLNKLSLTKVHYVVVGGWLNELLTPLFIRYLRYFDSVNVELESMKKRLVDNGIKAFVLPNYREYEFETKAIGINNKVPCLKLVYFSRVMREKGIFDAIDLIIKCNSNNVNVTFSIYGTLCFSCEKDSFKFLELVNSIKNISFFGELNSAEIDEYLVNYDVLLFPTFYKGEGLPGCIVDAKRNGLMVLCSDWKYNSEIVQEGIDGFIISDFKDGEVINKLEILSNDKSLLLEMKNNSYRSSKNYSNLAFEIWFNNLHLNQIQ